MLALLAVTAVTQCQARTVGPGSLRRGGTAGASCMLAAFDDHCRPAAYTLSSFGVDTIRTFSFRTTAHGNGCAVSITETFRVVPQQPRVLSRRVCARVHKTDAGIVADRCTPAGAVSLTRMSP
ncbi:MAG TPA: hypothetical protein VMU74_01120 [Gaiellaceae bacterium]|nr:hypothetical protein [Gaiellaceae bacterium]